VYDERCLLHQANYAHVEQPARASTTMQLLKSTGVYQRCVHVPSRPARDEELVGSAEKEGAHTHDHVALIDGTASYAYKEDEPDSETEGDSTMYPDCKFLDSDTYVNRHSSTAARLAIGGLVDLCEAVLQGRLRNGFAVIRPPGHHADSRKASGFCLYNNVACAVQALKAKHPDTLKKFMIVDFDVHHGEFQSKPSRTRMRMAILQAGSALLTTSSPLPICPVCLCLAAVFACL
jgi:histone deacetylase 6